MRSSNNNHLGVLKKILFQEIPEKTLIRMGYCHRHLAYLKSLHAHKFIQLQDSLITLSYFKLIMEEIQTIRVFAYKPKLAQDKAVVITEPHLNLDDLREKAANKHLRVLSGWKTKILFSLLLLKVDIIWQK